MKTRHKIAKGMIPKIIGYIGRYKLLFAFSLLMGAISVCLTLYIPKLVGNAIDLITDKGGVDLEKTLKILLLGFFCIIAATLSQWVMGVINNKITYNVVRDIRRDAFGKIEILPLSYIDTHPTGETVSRVISDADQFADGLLLGFSQFFTGVLTIAGTLFFMLTISPAITLIVVVLTPISLFVAAFIAKKTHRMFTLRAATNARQTAFIDESITSHNVITAFGLEDKKQATFDEINAEFERYSIRAIFFSALTNPCTRFVNSIVYAAVAVVGALSVMGFGNGLDLFFSGITVGSLATLLSYANQYTKPFNEISGVFTELQNSLACAERIFELIDAEPEVADGEDSVEVKKPSGEVSFDDVSF